MAGETTNWSSMGPYITNPWEFNFVNKKSYEFTDERYPQQELEDESIDLEEEEEEERSAFWYFRCNDYGVEHTSSIEYMLFGRFNIQLSNVQWSFNFKEEHKIPTSLDTGWKIDEDDGYKYKFEYIKEKINYQLKSVNNASQSLIIPSNKLPTGNPCGSNSNVMSLTGTAGTTGSWSPSNSSVGSQSPLGSNIFGFNAYNTLGGLTSFGNLSYPSSDAMNLAAWMENTPVFNPTAESNPYLNDLFNAFTNQNIDVKGFFTNVFQNQGNQYNLQYWQRESSPGKLSAGPLPVKLGNFTSVDVADLTSYNQNVNSFNWYPTLGNWNPINNNWSSVNVSEYTGKISGMNDWSAFTGMGPTTVSNFNPFYSGSGIGMYGSGSNISGTTMQMAEYLGFIGGFPGFASAPYTMQSIYPESQNSKSGYIIPFVNGGQYLPFGQQNYTIAKSNANFPATWPISGAFDFSANAEIDDFTNDYRLTICKGVTTDKIICYERFFRILRRIQSK